jgi:hypothetical protein
MTIGSLSGKFHQANNFTTSFNLTALLPLETLAVIDAIKHRGTCSHHTALAVANDGVAASKK